MRDYMSLYEIMMKRRSVRNFKDQNIPEDIISKLLDVANNAPSAGNIQPISIIIVQEKERRKELAGLLDGFPWIKNAPLTLIFCIDFYRVKKWASLSDTEFFGEKALPQFLMAYADTICAAQNIVILAESYGLGSVYVGTIQIKLNKIRRMFSIPSYILPIISLSIGYPETIPKHIPKLKTSAIIHKEKYNILSDDDITEAYNNKYGIFNDNLDEYIQKVYVEAIEYDKQENSNMIKIVKERMEKFGIKNHAQFLFNLRYPSKAMVAINKKMFREFKDAGFEFNQ
jgi:FMN reductase [NAD(P)H]